MALINGMYLHVIKESVKNAYDITDNKVETGLPLADHVERKPVELSISATLLDTDTQTAYDQYVKLRNWAASCTIVQFVGRNVLNVAITNIAKDNDYKIANGATVTISLKEIRIGQNSFSGMYTTQKSSSGTSSNTATKVKAKATKQVQTTSNTKVTVKNHKVRDGETLSGIVGKYGNRSMSEIKTKNHLTSNKLEVGKWIMVDW